MTGNSKLPGDEEISAWIDGGLDEEGSARMTHLASTEEAVGARAARLRHMDDLLRTAVPQDDDVPADLLNRLGLGAEAPAGSAEVIDLATARAAQANRTAQTPRRWHLPQGFARLAAQVLLFVGVGFGAVGLRHETPSPQSQEDAPYRVLGDSAGLEAPANAMIMLAPGTSHARAATIAAEAGARLVGKPGPSGTVRLSIDPARRDAVLAALRSDPEVTLAEPLDGDRP